MDAGCEMHGYCSDVTRTWPLPAHSGGPARFSGGHRAVYDVVAEAHAACLAACRPGATLRDLQNIAVRILLYSQSSINLCSLVELHTTTSVHVYMRVHNNAHTMNGTGAVANTGARAG